MLADRAALRLVAARSPRPDDSVLAHVDAEVAEALALFDAKGWAQAPETYHRTPPVPDSIRTRPAAQRQPSLHEPDLAGRLRGLPRRAGGSPVRRAPVQPGRPCCTGRAAVLATLARLCARLRHGLTRVGSAQRSAAQHLRSDLGLNLAFPVLPFHGRRNPGGVRSSPAVPGIDVLDNLHGMAQAVWDVRQLLRLLRERTDQPIGLMGLSLGGAVAATVASLDEPHAVLLLAPAVDLPSLMQDVGRTVQPRRGRRRSTRRAITRRDGTRVATGARAEGAGRSARHLRGDAGPVRQAVAAGGGALATLGRTRAALVPRGARLAVLVAVSPQGDRRQLAPDGPRFG